MKQNEPNTLSNDNGNIAASHEEQKGFDLFLTRARQLAARVEGVPKHLALLMLATVLAMLWLWTLLFANAASWLQIIAAILFVGVVIPIFFVYQLYELSKTVLSLPEKLIELRERIQEEESFQAFALAEIKNRSDAFNMFSILSELRAFFKASGGLAGLSGLVKLRFVKALNPFFSVATLYSLAVCWLVSFIGVISFIVFLVRL